MQRKRTIVKYLTALLLLVIFLAVHVGKALHTHLQISNFSQEAGKTEKIQSSSHCAICDYHFTKDSGSETAMVALPISQDYASTFLIYRSPIYASIGLHYSDRGPPAFV